MLRTNCMFVWISSIVLKPHSLRELTWMKLTHNKWQQALFLPSKCPGKIYKNTKMRLITPYKSCMCLSFLQWLLRPFPGTRQMRTESSVSPWLQGNKQMPLWLLIYTGPPARKWKVTITVYLCYTTSSPILSPWGPTDPDLTLQPVMGTSLV